MSTETTSCHDNLEISSLQHERRKEIDVKREAETREKVLVAIYNAGLILQAWVLSVLFHASLN